MSYLSNLLGDLMARRYADRNPQIPLSAPGNIPSGSGGPPPDVPEAADSLSPLAQWPPALPRASAAAAPAPTSPIQQALDAAIRQEMARPQGQWQSSISENVLSPHQAITGMDMLGNMIVKNTTPGQESQMPGLAAAAAQSDAAMNAHRDQRLAALLGGAGQMGANEAEMVKGRAAESMAATEAQKLTPEYMNNAMKMGIIHGTNEPASNPLIQEMVPGLKIDPATLVRKAVGVAPGAAVPTADDAFSKFVARGGLPGTPEAAAMREQYPEEVTAAESHTPMGTGEQLASWLPDSHPMLGGLSVGHLASMAIPGLGPAHFALGMMGGHAKQGQLEREANIKKAGVGVPVVADRGRPGVKGGEKATEKFNMVAGVGKKKE